MKERAEELKDLLRNLEVMKSDLMERICELENRIRVPGVPLETVYPPAAAKQLLIRGFPVYQFAYEGALPLYQPDGQYRASIRHYYFRATFEAFEHVVEPKTFRKAAVVVFHYFKNQQIRDLDNRNRKFLLDALRQTVLVKDDSWQDLSILEEGYFDPSGDHVQVYVLERENLSPFLTHMSSNHENQKIQPGSNDDFVHKQEKNRFVKKEKLNLENCVMREEGFGLWN